MKFVCSIWVGVEVFSRPKLEEAARALKNAVSTNSLCLVVAECEVEYLGRASSKLTKGERLILLKQDGSVLIHRPLGYEPVNWQPPGSIVSVQLADNCFLLKAVRLRPHEELLARVYRVLLLAYGKLRDKGEFYMHGSEEEIRDILAENLELVEKGLRLVEVERKVKPGFIDILCVDGEGRLVAVEIKRGIAGAEAVIQLKRYVEALREELGGEVRGILIAEGLARGVKGLLIKEGLEYRRLDRRRVEEIRRSTSRHHTIPYYWGDA